MGQNNSVRGLNHDIVFEILHFLDIWDAAQLLKISTALYNNESLWRTAFRASLRVGSLACSPGVDATTLSLDELRRLLVKTARIQGNLSSASPAFRRLRKLSLNPDVRVIHIIPGAQLLIGYDPFPRRDRRHLCVWDARLDREVVRGEVRGARPLDRWAVGNDGVSQGECLIALTSSGYPGEESSRTCCVFRLDFRIRDAVVLQEVFQRPIEIPSQLFPSMTITVQVQVSGPYVILLSPTWTAGHFHFRIAAIRVTKVPDIAQVRLVEHPCVWPEPPWSVNSIAASLKAIVKNGTLHIFVERGGIPMRSRLPLSSMGATSSLIFERLSPLDDQQYLGLFVDSIHKLPTSRIAPVGDISPLYKTECVYATALEEGRVLQLLNHARGQFSRDTWIIRDPDSTVGNGKGQRQLDMPREWKDILPSSRTQMAAGGGMSAHGGGPMAMLVLSPPVDFQHLDRVLGDLYVQWRRGQVHVISM